MKRIILVILLFGSLSVKAQVFKQYNDYRQAIGYRADTFYSKGYKYTGLDFKRWNDSLVRNMTYSGSTLTITYANGNTKTATIGAGSALSMPVNQVVYGTGAGVASSGRVKVDLASGYTRLSIDDSTAVTRNAGIYLKENGVEKYSVATSGGNFTVYNHALSAGAFDVEGATNSVKFGGSYLNFGTTYGVNGYGIRNNSGTIQFKHNGGTWTTPQGALTLTTTGTSGAATLVGNTLNIPQYAGGAASLSYASNALASQYTLTAGSGVTLASVTLADGVWMVSGQATFLNNGSTDDFSYIQITNGGTIVSEAKGVTLHGNQYGALHASTIITVTGGPKTVGLMVGSTTALLVQATNGATQINAVKIQ